MTDNYTATDGTRLFAPFDEITHDIDGRVVCHFCGKTWISPLNHAVKTHGIPGPEYRLLTGLTRYISATHPKFQANASTIMTHQRANPDSPLSRAIIDLHADPKFHAKMLMTLETARNNPKFKTRRLERLAIMWANPKFRANQAAAASTRMTHQHANPDSPISRALTALNANPYHRANNRANLIALNANPAFQTKRITALRAALTAKKAS